MTGAAFYLADAKKERRQAQRIQRHIKQVAAVIYGTQIIGRRE